jgi:hypothetical protein
VRTTPKRPRHHVVIERLRSVATPRVIDMVLDQGPESRVIHLPLGDERYDPHLAVYRGYRKE